MIKTKKKYIACFRTITWLIICGASHGASFDCEQAATKVEIMICENKIVSSLDEQYSNAFNKVLSRSSAPETVRDEARMWLREVRDQCPTSNCLISTYLDRLATLNETLNPEEYVDQQVFEDELSDASPDGIDYPELQNESTADYSAQHQDVSDDDIVGDTNISPSVVSSANENTPIIIESDQGQFVEESKGIAHVEPPVSSVTPVNSKRQGSLIKDQLFKLLLWGMLATLVGTLVFAVLDKAVFFYNTKDAWWAISPIIFLVVGGLVISSLSPPRGTTAETTIIEYLAIAATIASSAFGVFQTFRNAIKYNRSVVVGVVVGTVKILVSVFMAVTFVGSAAAVVDNKSSRMKVAKNAVVIMLIGVLWAALVNGDRVYAKRGWQHA